MRSAKILVIEDDDLVRPALMALLTRLGHQPIGAVNGQAGLEAVKKGGVDLALCDMRMPVLDGVGFLEAVQALPDAPPVIVMSGAGLLDDAVEALRLGAWDYITKPIFGVEVLEHTVNKALERKALLEENRRINGELRATLGILAEGEDAGRQLQFRMLPQNHQMFGPFEFSRELLPSVYLSGDFVDAFSIDERRWGFYLADVAGHGVSSALVTVLLRGAVQRYVEAMKHSNDPLVLSPRALLSNLNEQLVREPVDKHVTLFYGVIDVERSTLTWSSAGHFPWPIVFDGQRAQVLSSSSVPLGMFPGSQYEERSLTLGPDVVLAACSDGLLEVLPPKSLDEKLELLRSVFARFDVTVEQAHAELHLDEVSPLPDDVAMLIVKRGGAHADPGQLRAP